MKTVFYWGHGANRYTVKKPFMDFWGQSKHKLTHIWVVTAVTIYDSLLIVVFLAAIKK